MQPKVGLVLLSWSGLSAILTVWAFVLAYQPEGLIDKSLVPQTFTITEGGALDDSKLEARCTEEFRDPPQRDLQGQFGAWSLAHWLGAGTSHMVGQAVSVLAWGSSVGTVVSAACGIACMRRPRTKRPQNELY
jgi:hypothetical protein